ncbi:type II/IV secretion system protein [Myxococcota bacterium]|nr:type II/IV secretion system protein [Myxococcota bacterium]
MAGQLFGEILKGEGLIDDSALARALERQASERPRRRLGELLVLERAVRDDAIALGLSRQYGFPLVDPVTAPVDPEVLSHIDADQARRLGALPLYSVADQVVRVAAADPLDLGMRRDLEFALGRALEVAVAPASRIEEAIQKHFNLERQLAAILSEVRPQGVADRPGPGLRTLDVDSATVDGALREGAARPFTDLLNFLLADAHFQRASDIHVEPHEHAVRVRYRVDGVLREVVRLPRWVDAGLVSRTKVVAGLDIAERRRAQDGRVRVLVGGREIDLRISVMPSQFGETVVIRLLDPTIVEADLGALGLQPYVYQTYYRLVSRPQGLVLITGPTGSGKSTTLYATINRLRSEQTSIVTIEDPIEYTISGITQVGVDEKRGMTFAQCIRAMLRQDPNVLIIGEIRDRDTAQAACQAALTGHLVFATLHTNDTVASVTRLLDLDVPPYLLGATLTGIVAQRLVRRLCRACRLPAAPGDLDWGRLGLAPMDLGGQPHRVGPGCHECRYTGFQGRTGIYEILPFGDAMRDLVHQKADERRMREHALSAGMRTLLDDGLTKVREGITSIEEVARVAPSPAPVTLPAGTGVEARASATGAFRALPRPEPSPAPAGAATPAEPVETRLDTSELPVLSMADISPLGEPRQVPDDAETLLVVDDAEEILELVRFTLESAGFRVLTARDGPEALEVVKRHPVSLVVLDVMMPGMSGFEVCRALKQDVKTAFLPVLMLSARGDQAHIKSGFRAGADDYLPKPFDPEELELRVRALLRRTFAAAAHSV